MQGSCGKNAEFAKRHNRRTHAIPPRINLCGVSRMSELWTVARVARHLDVSKKRVYQLIHLGCVDSLRLSPRAIRITRVSVERYLERQLAHQRAELGLDVAVSAERRHSAR
jgi:hypothetical protein